MRQVAFDEFDELEEAEAYGPGGDRRRVRPAGIGRSDPGRGGTTTTSPGLAGAGDR